MATGGIFTLITNDGRQDRMLMATELLNQRLASIRETRKNMADPTPTLVDIEKTHILFMNAHFKPFASIGYEYNKVNAQSGQTALGSEIQFSIPQFGDFFHDMVFHCKIKQPTLTYTPGTAVSDRPLMRWCAYPGERLMKKTSFNVNGNPLDEYKSDVYNFYREFQLAPNKRLAWDRCVGQEVAETGFVDQPNWERSGVDSAAVLHREQTVTFSGNQTPTAQKSTADADALEMFVPLLFWCNKDPRLSVPSVSIPYGQRFINITLANQNELVNLVPRGSGTWAAPNGSFTSPAVLQRAELYINNIFVNPEVHDIFIQRVGFTLIRVHRQQTHTAATGADEVLLQQLKWPIESLFVGMRVNDYVSTNSTLQAEHLDKWHRFSEITPTVRSNAGYEVSKVYALTGTSVAIAAADGAGDAVVTGVATQFDTELSVGDFLVVNGVSYKVGTVTSALLVTVSTLGSAALQTASTDFYALKKSAVTSTVEVSSKTIDSITIKAHGIPIYNDFPSAFYNAYLPLHYGGANLMAPQDVGALFIPFCLYPGTYQPNGHINVSRAREFYISYTSSVINTNKVGSLVVLASAINFLLISDGSAVLRYST